MSTYRDAKGNIRKELLQDDAMKLADEFIKIGDNGKPINKPELSLTSAQLRKFYNEFKSLEKRYLFNKTGKSGQEEAEKAFLPILPLVKMVDSKVHYANSGKPKIPRKFAQWLSTNINNINEAKDFEAFLLHFEAVVGFCYGMGLSD